VHSSQYAALLKKFLSSAHSHYQPVTDARLYRGSQRSRHSDYRGMSGGSTPTAIPPVRALNPSIRRTSVSGLSSNGLGRGWLGSRRWRCGRESYGDSPLESSASPHPAGTKRQPNVRGMKTGRSKATVVTPAPERAIAAGTIHDCRCALFNSSRKAATACRRPRSSASKRSVSACMAPSISRRSAT
jgi:hypothetical protein